MVCIKYLDKNNNIGLKYYKYLDYNTYISKDGITSIDPFPSVKSSRTSRTHLQNAFPVAIPLNTDELVSWWYMAIKLFDMNIGWITS